MEAPLRISDVRAALDRLFATGRYENIEIDAQPDGESVALPSAPPTVGLSGA